MWQNRKVRIFIAFVIAICFWVYVKSLVDPAISKSVSGVDVNMTHQAELFAKNLAIDDVDVKKIDVSLRGSRSDLASVSEANVKANVDLTYASRGANYLDIEVSTPNGVTLKEQSVKNANVNVDTLERDEKAIDIVVDNSSMPPGESIAIRGKSIDTATLIGTKKNLAKVRKVVATVGAGDVMDEVKTQKFELEALDKNGAVVEFVATEEKSVYLDVVRTSKKEVKLDVDTEGKAADGYKMTWLEVSDKVTIVGDKKDIDKIESVKADNIDITGMNQTQSITITADLPEGVSFEKKLKATIHIAKMSESVITFSKDEIEIRNVDRESTYEIKSPINIEVSFMEDMKLVKEDLLLYIDVGGIYKGEQKVKLRYQAPADAKIELSAEEVDVLIK